LNNQYFNFFDMKNKTTLIVLLALAAVLSAVARLVPHPSNFVPLGALALVSGAYIRSRWGLVLPLVVMVATDTLIGWHNIVFFTWGCYLLMTMMGWWIREKKSFWRILSAALGGSFLFFVVTNAAVWAFTPLYAKTVTGLVQCYYLALPFFRNTVASDLIFSAIFFGAFEVVLSWVAQRREKLQTVLVK